VSVTVLCTESSRPFAERLAGCLGVPLQGVHRETFPDGERYLRLDLADRFGLLGYSVVIVGATDSAASLEDVYRLGSVAVKHGARALVLVVPYFGYSTMERAVRPGEAVTAKIIARQLSGIPRAGRGNWLLTMDLHSAGIVHYFEGDTVALELYAESRLLPAIERLGLSKLTLASTDMGRAKWVERYANVLHAPVALIHKKRHSGSEVSVAAVVGDVDGRDVVIFDDMIRSGVSLVQAAQTYRRAGARSVYAVATHLVLPEGSVERLEAAPLEKVIGTDTHPRHQAVAARPRFEVVGVADLFADVVGRLVE
jgi:ribose-phosphate pyrophosphokinase